MSKPLAFGLNLKKKAGPPKPAPVKGKPMFGGDDSESDDGANDTAKTQAIGGGDLDDFSTSPNQEPERTKPSKPKNGLVKEPPKLKSKAQPSAMFGDLSSALESRKNAEAAAELDSSVYDYDSVYDSFKPKKQTTKEDEERKPKYMRNLLQAAEVRKRDALIAEEKKIARERDAEGDEYEDKEKFVTAAYKKQQEENRRIEEEEKKREEEEAKKNEGGGMSAFYRKLLDKDEQRHAETVKAAEEMAKGGGDSEDMQEEEMDADKEQAAFAKDLNEKGAAVDVNEDGQVVDKRQLLRGGLNIDAKKKSAPVQQEKAQPAECERKDNYAAGQFGRRQAQRERQSRMMQEQLEQSMKRAMEEEESQKQEVERASKSRKTEGEISSAKERYLARKKAAEEAKKANGAGAE